MSRSMLLPTLLVVSSLMTVGCGGDDPAAPEPVPPLAAGTVDADGGELVHPDVVLTIPAGALDLAADLSIHASTVSHPFANTGAASLRLEGLPAELGEPVTLRFRHGLALDAGDTLACFLGEEREGHEFPRGLAWFVAACRDSAGWCITRLERGALALDDKAAGPVQVTVDDDIACLVHDDNHFRLVFRRSQLDHAAAVELLGTFEYQHGATTSMGFGFGNFPDIWPLDVIVYEPEFSECCYVAAPRGAGHFFISPALAVHGTAIAPLVAHEVLHCAQTFYDPRPPAHWGVLNQERLWLDEATAAWVEAVTAGTADYVPAGMEVPFFTAPLAGFAGKTGMGMAEYGYGMAQFVRYLCEDQGSGQSDERLAALYEHFGDHGDVTDAIDAVLDPPVAAWLTDMQRKTVEGRLYDPDPPGFTWTVWPIADSLPSPLGSRAWDRVDVPDLGAALVKFMADDTEAPTASSLWVAARPAAGQPAEHLPLAVYGRAPDEPLALIATGTDSLSVADWPGIWDTYDAVMVLVSRPRSTHAGHAGSIPVDVAATVVPDLTLIDLSRFNRVAIETTTDNSYANGNVFPNDLITTMGSTAWLGDRYFAATADDTFALSVDPGSGALSSWLASTRYTSIGGNYIVRRLQGGPLTLDTATPDELIYRCFGAACCEVLVDVFESEASDPQTPPFRRTTGFACRTEENPWWGSMIYVHLFHMD